jgi:hypothetical protein
MRRRYAFLNNFTSGEISPRLLTRVDNVAHKNGAKTMRNAIPTVHGGFKGRPGLRFVARARYANKVCHLIPFKYSVDQTYVIEAGDQYFRFFTQGGRLEESAKTVSNVDASGTLIRITTSAAHGYSTGDSIAIRSVVGVSVANNDWTITVTSATQFTLDGSTFSGSYTSGGSANKIIQIATPYLEADLVHLRWAQDADVMYLVHPSYAPRTLVRTSALVFTLSTVTFVGGPFQALNGNASLTMTPSATTGSITVTASSAYFVAGHVGMFMRIAGVVSGVQGFVEFTGYTSSTVMSATVKATLSGTGATDNWAIGSFGTVSGWPSDVTFIDQRLALAGTTTEPQTVWLAAVGGTPDFTVGTAADDAVTLPLKSEDLNAIRWLAASDVLLVGTVGGEFKVTGGDGGAISPSNALARQQSSYGSDRVRPVKLGNTVIYVQRAGHRLRDLQFNFDKDRYISNDISLLAEHLFETATITRLGFQLQPDPIVWMVLSDGTLASLVTQPEQQITAFQLHSTAVGSFESIAVLPESSSQNDRVWTAVRRTVNAATVRYIEYFDPTVNTDATLTGTFSPAVTTIRGLEHLNAATVQVLGDGAVYADKTVASGAITLGSGESAIESIEVGLGFTPTVSPRPPIFEDSEGLTFGRVARYVRLLVYGLDTMYLYLNGEVTPARSASDAMDAPPPTDDESVFQFTTLGSSTQHTVTITQPAPLPLHVTSVYGEVEIGG